MTLLLALHGFTGSPHSWDFLPNEQELPRIVPALVGHAGSDAGADVTRFEGEVDRLASLIPQHTTAHVIGYSLGARLALSLTLRHPARVSRLSLVSCHPGLTTDMERSARRVADEAWCDLLLTRGLTAFVDEWQALPLWDTQAELPDALRAQKRAERLSHEAVGLARSLRSTGIARMPCYVENLAKIRVPVDLIAGALDHKFSALAELMAERIPQATLEIVPSAGHDLLLERPAFITEVIRRGNQT